MPLTLLLVAWAALLVGLESLPPVWWDEGWTLSVARNLAERGFYGRLLDGARISPTLAAAAPVTLPVSVSFALFGAGLWQGRLTFAAFTMISFALMAHLAARLSGRRASTLTIALLLAGFGSALNHPLLMGRQVLGEMPMLCYLLAGYAALMTALRHKHSRMALVPMLLAIVLWALGIFAKRQALPFWALSLAAPLLLAALRRNWHSALMLALGLIGAYGLEQALAGTRALWLPGYVSMRFETQQLEALTAFVLARPARLDAARIVLAGLPVVAGLLAALPVLWAERAGNSPRAIVRTALFALSAGFLAWFAALSAGWPRYAFPWMFVGTLFAADALSRWTGRLRLTAQSPRWRAIAAALLATAWLGSAARAWLALPAMDRDKSAIRAAAAFAALTSPDARIGTYESEMIFLLDRRHVYPPDDVHVELIRSRFFEPAPGTAYDVTGSDPDYLLLGPFGYDTWLYRRVLERGDYRLIMRAGHYDLYARALRSATP